MSDAGAGATISLPQEILRKAVHLSSLWMACLIFFWRGNRLLLSGFFAVCLILNLLWEHACASRVPVLTPAYRFLFRKMLRKEPEPGDWVISGSPPVFAAACLVSLLFPQVIAAISMAVMLTADTAAALVGRRFGIHRVNGGKSWEGTIAFCLTGLAVSLAGLAFGGMLSFRMGIGAACGVFLAALAEFFQKQLRLDDNLTIPLASGGVMTLFFYLF